MPPDTEPPRLSLRAHLITLVVATIAPLLLLMVALVAWNTHLQRETLEKGMVSTARAMAEAMDRENASIIGELQALGISEDLAQGNLDEFRKSMVHLKRMHPEWVSVLLADPHGQQLINLQRTPNEALPGIADAATIAQIRGTRQPAVTDLIFGKVAGRQVVAILAPVVLDGEVRYLLGAVLRPEAWAGILVRQHLADGWLAVLMDRSNRIVARMAEQASYEGRPAPVWYSSSIAGRSEGVLSGQSLQGHEIVVGFSRLGTAGWTVVYGAPTSVVQQPLLRALAAVALAGGGFLLMALIMAAFLGRRITTPVGRLTEASAQIDRGWPVPPLPSSGIVEIDALGEALTEASERISHAQAQVRRSNEAKARFLASASHDLRQPFQAMRLFQEVLHTRLKDSPEAVVVDRLGEAMRAGEDLLNSLLDVSSIEAGRLRPENFVFRANDILFSLANSFQPVAEEKGLAIRVFGAEHWVRSDPVILKRIVTNLLVNAIRYTPSGGILLSVRRRRDRVVIQVWDSGIGIAPDKLDAIFEDFYQVGNAERDRSQGIGLGLSIVDRMARLLGHGVDVKSRLGKGSVFSVTVPRAHKPAEEPVRREKARV